MSKIIFKKLKQKHNTQKLWNITKGLNLHNRTTKKTWRKEDVLKMTVDFLKNYVGYRATVQEAHGH